MFLRPENLTLTHLKTYPLDFMQACRASERPRNHTGNRATDSFRYGSMRVLIPLLLILQALPAIAQITTASLQGLVRDSSGAVITGAQVKVVNMDTNVATPTVTNSTGRFLAPSLPPGRYEVVV